MRVGFSISVTSHNEVVSLETSNAMATKNTSRVTDFKSIAVISQNRIDHAIAILCMYFSLHQKIVASHMIKTAMVPTWPP